MRQFLFWNCLLADQHAIQGTLHIVNEYKTPALKIRFVVSLVAFMFVNGDGEKETVFEKWVETITR